MNLTPRVTVYIANHNYAEYLAQAVDSVLAQTFSDFELIIIDDGSEDGSAEIIESYRERERVRIIYQHNQGLTVTNNIALRAARGQYIMRLDADDWLNPHAIELLAGRLDRDPDVVLVFPDYYEVDVGGDIIEHVRRHDFSEVSLLDQPAHGACTMIRVANLKAIGGYDERNTCQDGYEVWLRLIKHHRVANLDLPLFFYRKHGSSLSDDSERILQTRRKLFKRRAEAENDQVHATAVIPVRRLDEGPGAMTPLFGRPLIDWTLIAALEAGAVTEVIFSTPDPTLRQYVQDVHGDAVHVIARPVPLAAENSGIGPTITHALRAVPRETAPEAILHLSIHSPFRSATHINEAMDAMSIFGTDMVIGVRPEPDIFYMHSGHGLRAIRKTESLRLEREDIFREVGSMRLWKADSDERRRRIGHVVMDRLGALRLKEPGDIRYAEFLWAEHSS